MLRMIRTKLLDGCQVSESIWRASGQSLEDSAEPIRLRNVSVLGSNARPRQRSKSKVGQCIQKINIYTPRWPECNEWDDIETPHHFSHRFTTLFSHHFATVTTSHHFALWSLHVVALVALDFVWGLCSSDDPNES